MARSKGTARKPKAIKASKGSSGGSGPKTPVILVLAKLKSAGNDRPTRAKVSQLSGYPFHSLSTTLLNLKKKKGYVEYDKESTWLTDKGLEAAKKEHGVEAQKPLDTASAHQVLIETHKIKGSKLKIFELLRDSDHPLTSKEIMENIGCTNAKSFGTYISALNTANITESVVEEGVKKIQLDESTCFPFGRSKA